MKLVKCILIVQLSCLCQAQTPASTQTDEPTNLQLTTEGNNTGIVQEEFTNDPRVQQVAGKCSFTLTMHGGRSSDVVALPADSTDVLVEQMCRDLNCGALYSVNKTRSPPGATCFHDCLYRDGRLQNCSESVGGNCNVIAEAICSHQAVRLIGGADRCAGRVELWRDGDWGTVCDDQWDLRDADVVCAQLGCGYALSVTGQGGSFPPGRGPVHLDELNCTGREGNLWACPAAQDEPDCGHKEDAGVVCSEMRAVRLTGGLDSCSGRVEVHRNGSWGTVCDNCWNKNMASRVCSMLQCGAEPQKYSQFLPHLPHNNGTLWFYRCGPNVPSLWQCMEFVNRRHLCSSSKASGVICNGSLGFPEPTTATPANATVITGWTTGSVNSHEGFRLPSPEILSIITLALILLVVLVMNSVVCCHYRRRHAFLVQQTRTSPRPPSGHHHSSNQDAVDLVKVTSNPLQTEVPSNPRYLRSQLSSVDSTSVDTDYEQYETSNDASVPLSTFRNSQRYRVDVNPLMKPSGLDSLLEEAPEPTENVMGVYTGCNGDPVEVQYARVSKISMDSFESSSTSSGECYENTHNRYAAVTPDGEDDSGEDDGPLYSPVCPDQNPSCDYDYDDIGAS